MLKSCTFIYIKENVHKKKSLALKNCKLKVHSKNKYWEKSQGNTVGAGGLPLYLWGSRHACGQNAAQ